MSPDEVMPEVYEGALDEEGLERLFAEVGQGAELLEVLLKGGDQERARGAGATLAQARAMLWAREVGAVQLRYRYEGAQWWDTLMRTAEGARLVRVRHGWMEVAR
jgi:hypothetical protein